MVSYAPTDVCTTVYLSVFGFQPFFYNEAISVFGKRTINSLIKNKLVYNDDMINLTDLGHKFIIENEHAYACFCMEWL